MPNDKPLKPDDFPVEVEGDELMTADGKPIAKAKTPDIAEDIADRLNEDDYRKEQDRQMVGLISPPARKPLVSPPGQIAGVWCHTGFCRTGTHPPPPR